MSEWYYTGVLVLAHGHSIESAFVKITKLMNLKLHEVQNCVTRLIDLGLLRVNQNQVLEISSSQLMFNDPRSLNLAQEVFLQKQIELSYKSFRKMYRNKTGKYLSYTLTTPPDSITNIQSRFFAFMENISAEMDQVSNPESSEAVQINIQIFPPKSFG